MLRSGGSPVNRAEREKFVTEQSAKVPSAQADCFARQRRKIRNAQIPDTLG
jgi:hypothetical protein